ncbi:MAG: hypothetical protein GY795_24565 [Desulfobacterales bacterium]|nr:hypothetical protein [Desulfobacterales bacterium]
MTDLPTPTEALAVPPADVPHISSPAFAAWTPENDEHAAWLLNTLRRHLAERADIEAKARVELERIQEWQADRSAGLAAVIESVESKIEAYQEAMAEADKPRLSLSLPGGELSSTAGRERLVIDDEEAFVAWAEEEDERAFAMLEYTASPMVAEIKKLVKAKEKVPDGEQRQAFTEDGEAVPGVVLERGTRSYKVKPAPVEGA